MFLKQYNAGLDEVIHIGLAPFAMTLGHDLGHLRSMNHLELANHVFLKEK